MKKITAAELAAAAGGTLISGDPAALITHITTDSRSVPENALFVPVAGENTDGHLYLEKALLAGARASLCSEEKYLRALSEEALAGAPALILVNDTTEAFQKIAKEVRRRLSLPAVGVTGSVGKTTTREMIALALSAQRKVFKTDHNYNNKLGVPITLCGMTDDQDIAVLELGMNVPGELGLIASLTRLSAAVITNIGVAHMEYYGTQEAICREKLTVTRGFWPEDPSEKVLFLNADDPYLMRAAAEGLPFRTVLYGTAPGAEYRAEGIRREGGKTKFELVRPGKTPLTVTLSVPGVHHVQNALAALAVSDFFGVDLSAAAEALSGYTGYKNRLERTEKDGVLIIDDTYNASPASMKAGISVLCGEERPAGTENGRRIAVLGDMLELGERAPQFHFEVGEYIARMPVDLLVLLGPLAREIGRGASSGERPVPSRSFDSRAEAAAALKAFLRPGDIVYLKASNGMKLKEIAEELKK